MKNAIVFTVTMTLLAASAVFADTVILQPDGAESKDAYVWENHPTYNYNDFSLALGVYNGRMFSYIEFEELDSYEGATVNEATVHFYTFLESGDLNNYNYISRITEDWGESSITWDNKPDYDDTSTVTFGSPYEDTWFSVNVTDIVGEWLDVTSPNHGFIIHNEIGYTASAYFYSGEYTGDPTLRPYLYLDYTPVVGIESASLGEIKAAFK